MFKKFKEDFFKKVRAAENQQQPTMYNSISAFEQPPIASMEIENRSTFNKGGYASISDMEKKCGSKSAKKAKR